MCSLCDDLGFVGANVPFGHPLFGRLVPCQCRSGRTSARLQAASGLNPDERLYTLADIEDSGPGTRHMLAAARVFVANPIGLLTVYGSYGNGKTITLMAIVNECLKRGLPAVYVRFTDLLDYIRDGFNEVKTTGEYSGRAYVRAQRFLSIRVLAIDELDDARDTEWKIEFEKGLFDRRYRDGNSHLTGTVLATNQRPEKFLDAKIVSRIRDGRNVVVENNDPDMRSGLTRLA